MSAIDTLESIVNCELVNYDFRYCFVNRSKIPYKPDGFEARTDVVTDFVKLEELMESPMLTRKRIVGIGISIQASKVCAIDVDGCFAEQFNFDTIDERGREVLDLFEDVAYCEFSFSGKGMRVLFLHDLIENYADTYYIKNSKVNIEYYQPSKSNRFVTVTGRYISNNPIQHTAGTDVALNQFLERFMVRPPKPQTQSLVADDNIDFEEAVNKTARLYITNSKFQSLWFSKAPGAGRDESERDYQIVAMLYENVTTDEDMIRQLFETSPYFQSKDEDHLRKWMNNDYRYLKYMYSHLR